MTLVVQFEALSTFNRQTDRQAYRQTYKWTDKQIDRQTDRLRILPELLERVKILPRLRIHIHVVVQFEAYSAFKRQIDVDGQRRIYRQTDRHS